MSLKGSVLSKLIQSPALNINYIVAIPDMLNTLWLCHNTTLPFEQRSTVEVNARGRTVPLPGLYSKSGTWTCDLYENDIPYTATALQLAKRHQVIDYEAQFVSHIHHLTSVLIFVTDQSTGLIPLYWYTLHDAWIKKVDPINLNWQNPDKIAFKVTFEYSRVTRSYLDDSKKSLADVQFPTDIFEA